MSSDGSSACESDDDDKTYYELDDLTNDNPIDHENISHSLPSDIFYNNYCTSVINSSLPSSSADNNNLMPVFGSSKLNEMHYEKGFYPNMNNSSIIFSPEDNCYNPYNRNIINSSIDESESQISDIEDEIINDTSQSNSITLLNASYSSQRNSNMLENNVSIASQIPDSQYEKRRKRKYALIDKKLEPTPEDMRKFNDFKNIKVKCVACGKEVSICEVFLVNSVYICIRCVKKKRIKLNKLKSVFFEELDFTGEKLYKCSRISHYLPLYLFIEYRKKDGKPKIEGQCPFCRLFKSLEYFYSRIKQKRYQCD